MLESLKSVPESDNPDILTGDTIVVDTGDLDTALQAASAVESVKIPETYAEAMSCADSAYWKQAVSEELTKLQALDTWSYTKLSPRKKLIGFTWVFTIKYTLTGLIDRYKARLVAQGFSQVLKDDYLETFSPTIRSKSLRILLALGACEGLEIY
jgi:hypothetical protein